MFASFDAHLCFWLLASGDTGHGRDLCLSECEKLPRGGGRGGVGGGGGMGGGEGVGREGWNFLLLIETL